MTKQNYEPYVAPASTVVEVKAEGVVCASGDVTTTMNGTFGEETI